MGNSKTDIFENIEFEITNFDEIKGSDVPEVFPSIFNGNELDQPSGHNNLSLTANTTPEIKENSHEILTDLEGNFNIEEILKSFEEVKKRISQVINLLNPGEKNIISENSALLDIQNWQSWVTYQDENNHSKIFWKIKKEAIGDTLIDKETREFICGSQKVIDLQKRISFMIDIEISVDPEILKAEEEKRKEEAENKLSEQEEQKKREALGLLKQEKNLKKRKLKKSKKLPKSPKKIVKKTKPEIPPSERLKSPTVDIEPHIQQLEIEGEAFSDLIQQKSEAIFTEEFKTSMSSNNETPKDLNIIAQTVQQYFELLNLRSSDSNDPTPRKILFQNKYTSICFLIERRLLSQDTLPINDAFDIIKTLNTQSNAKLDISSSFDKNLDIYCLQKHILYFLKDILLKSRKKLAPIKSKPLKKIIGDNLEKLIQINEWKSSSEDEKMESIQLKVFDTSENILSKLSDIIMHSIFAYDLRTSVIKRTVKKFLSSSFSNPNDLEKISQEIERTVLGKSKTPDISAALEFELKSTPLSSSLEKRSPRKSPTLLPGLGGNIGENSPKSLFTPTTKKK